MSRRPMRRSGPNWTLIGPIIVALIIGVAILFASSIDIWPFDNTPTPVLPTLTPTRPPSADLAVVIKLNSIQDGDMVAPELTSANGFYNNVLDDEEIWLVARLGSACFPMDGPATKEATGNWQHGPLSFPRSGEQLLSTVRVDSALAATLRGGVGKVTGIPCNNIEQGLMVETISIHVEQTLAAVTPTQQVTPTAIPTPTKTPIPEPENIIEGKVCETTMDEDRNTFFVSEAAFGTLQLDHPQPRVKVNIFLEDNSRQANNITLDMGSGDPACIATMSPQLLTPCFCPNRGRSYSLTQIDPDPNG